MITLYHAPRSRSSRIIWLLEELGAPYEIVQVDIKRGNGSGASDPANPHPHKQVPAILSDGELITESAAIVLYLTDKFPAAKLAPLPGQPHRGAYLTWLAYYAGVVEPALTQKFLNLHDAAPQLAAVHDTMVEHLQAAFKAKPYLVGDSFSAADLLFASMLQFARNLLPPDPDTDAFAAISAARPALARAMAKDGTPAA